MEGLHPAVQIEQVDTTDADLLAVIVRCLATTRLGAHFHGLSRRGQAVDLTLTEISRYPQVRVTEVHPPHGARLVFTGAGAQDLQLKAGDIFRGINPPT
ncbi:hypothetical protein [Actinoallomurus liliacearum]